MRPLISAAGRWEPAAGAPAGSAGPCKEGRRAVFWTAVLIALTLGMAAAERARAATAPTEIAGFRIGASIEDYRNRVDMDSAVPVRNMPYLREVILLDMPGYESGYLEYGLCEQPGAVLRIKLKYADDGKDFFNRLLDRFKQRFGEPSEYRGDPFHAYIAWKWSFQQENGDRISLVLQHYAGEDEEYTSGNSVKLTATSRIEREKACEDRKSPSKEKSGGTGDGKRGEKPVDFETFIPR